MKISLVDALLNALYPPRCILCDEIIAPDRYFCKECDGKISAAYKDRCMGCGLPLKSCECSRYIYHFDGVVSPFYNKDNAQKAYYNFKFLKNKRGADYFADKMARSVRLAYKDKEFDFLAYVPPTDKATEYDHTKILAERLAKRLDLKLVKALAPSGKKRSVQHSLGLDKRFENVHNAYRVTAPCRRRKILLVDDIKTSGATIDECARLLKLNGADSVYCVTALTGLGKKSD